jgi:hypothetical protein
MGLRIPVGIKEPNVLRPAAPGVTADSTNPTLTDLTAVTAVSLSVSGPVGPNGAWGTVVWPATIVSATAPTDDAPSTLMWQHAFTTGDVPLVGDYRVTPLLSVPGFADAIACEPAVTFQAVPLSHL